MVKFDLSGSFEEPRQLDGGCVQYLATDARKGREPDRGLRDMPLFQMIFQQKRQQKHANPLAPLVHG